MCESAPPLPRHALNKEFSNALKANTFLVVSTFSGQGSRFLDVSDKLHLMGHANTCNSTMTIFEEKMQAVIRSEEQTGKKCSDDF